MPLLDALLDRQRGHLPRFFRRLSRALAASVSSSACRWIFASASTASLDATVAVPEDVLHEVDRFTLAGRLGHRERHRLRVQPVGVLDRHREA